MTIEETWIKVQGHELCKCPKCGVLIYEREKGNKYCHKCGKPMTSEKQPSIVAHWISRQNSIFSRYKYDCSNCGATDVKTPYCYNCGARMIESQESEDKE